MAVSNLRRSHPRYGQQPAPTPTPAPQTYPGRGTPPPGSVEVQYGNQPGYLPPDQAAAHNQAQATNAAAQDFSGTGSQTPPPAAPPAVNNEDWGNTDDAYLRSQVDRVFAKYNRKPREDEYVQWGAGGYMGKEDVDGTGRKFTGWDPYWEKRLDQHARGDYYGDGFADEDGNAQLAARARAGIGGAPSTPGANLAGSAGVSGPAAGAPSPGAGWVQTASGGWVPPNHPDAAQAAAPNANLTAYQQRIAELLDTPQDIDAESLRETPEAQSFALNRQRQEERQRAQLMERASVDGYSGGAVEGELAGIRQDLGENEIGLLADLATQKMQQNREKLVQGIEFAMADNQFEKAQALTDKLAQLDASVQRESIRAGQSEGAAERALRRELGLLDIGFNYDSLGATMNQQAVLAALQAAGY